MPTDSPLSGAHHLADWWEPLTTDTVRCKLCPWSCAIPAGEAGRCRARANEDGRLVSLNYGRTAAMALDPIEKKPLYHFHPGATVLSLGSNGCNFTCLFCQNWQLSQTATRAERFSPAAAALEASSPRLKRSRCIGLAYTYSEPTVWAEYVRDTARAAHEHGALNVMVTNGYINPTPLGELLPLIDAWNIDVKAFSETFYRDVCGGRLEPVKETVAAVHRAGRHVEVTTLIIPGLNDDPAELAALCDWLADLSPDIPLHLSRYHPNYRMATDATPVETLVRARDEARRRLRYVYIGNAYVPGASDTCCPECGATVIRRSGMGVIGHYLRGQTCPRCGTRIAIVGEVIGQ